MGIGELLLLASLGALAEGEVQSFTSLADIRDCQAIPGKRDWLVATEGGVARIRHDGKLRAQLDASDGLPGTRSYSVLPDPHDVKSAWVSSEAGVARLDLSKLGLRVDRVVASDFPVRQLLPNGEGGWFAALWGGGVGRFDPHTSSSIKTLPSPYDASAASLRTTSLYELDGQLFVGTAGHGLWASDLSKTSALAPIDENQRGNFVWDLASDSHGLRVATLGGVIDARGRRVSGGDIRTLHHDEQGWLAADYAGGGTEIPDLPAPVAQIQALSRVGERMCVATATGLWLRDDEGKWTKHLNAGLPDQDIATLAVHPSNGRAWAGAFDGGLASFNGRTWTPLKIEGLDPQINALLLDPNKGEHLWIGTARGLFRLNTQNKKLEHWGVKEGLPGSKVLSLAPGLDGGVLVGSDRGPRRVRRGEIEELGPRVREWAVWSILEAVDDSGQSRVYLGTTQGLIEWRPDRAWRHLSVLSGHLKDNWITALQEREGTLWVGTYAAGVTRLERSAKDWRPTHLEGGRINPSGLRLDAQGELWASTMQGLLRRSSIDSSEEGWTRVDGLPGEDVTASAVFDSKLWVATRRGLQRR